MRKLSCKCCQLNLTLMKISFASIIINILDYIPKLLALFIKIFANANLPMQDLHSVPLEPSWVIPRNITPLCCLMYRGKSRSHE